MYALKNKIQLLGHLGVDAEIKTFDSGRKKASFRMATTEVFRDANGEKQEQTQWHNVVAWGNLAERIEKYTSKGSEILLEGKLVYRSYDGNDGQKKYFTEIEMRELMLMGAPKNQTPTANNTQALPQTVEMRDGLPF